MTYGEAIYKVKTESYTLYEKCGALRDAASLSEKQHWNNLRGLLSKAWDELTLLERLAEHNGTDDIKLNGNY